MVRTTSEIVSLFDEIYMGAEIKLMQKRKEVEALTERLKESERLCAQNVCHNLPDVKVERGQELLESVLFYGQSVPEMTEVSILDRRPALLLSLGVHVNITLIC